MEAQVQMIVVLSGVVITLIVMSVPQLFLLACAKLLIVPHLIGLKVLLFAFQKISKDTVRDGGKVQFTARHRVLLRLHLWAWKITYHAAETFNDFMRSEMIEVQSGRNSVDYVPVDERDKPIGEQCVITMRKLSKPRQAEIKDRMIKLSNLGRVDGLRNRTVRLAITREMIDGWKNVGRRDETGNVVPVRFDKKERTAMYEILPDTLTDELEARFGDGSLDWEAAEERIAEAEAEEEEFKDSLSALDEEEPVDQVA